MTTLFEGLEYKCMEGLIKPMIHVDEFSAKLGEDEDVIVISFYVRDQKAARDLSHWFEGYNEILDADTSPGELKPNRYLVYVEIRRRSNAGKIVARMLGDLDSLTEFEPSDWEMRYEDHTVPFSREAFEELVPLSPKAYKAQHIDDEEELNEWRARAGLDAKPLYDVTESDLVDLQAIAGIR